ncbi:PRD domain-containing protein [Lactobacillus sp. ESL0236]|uniref:BglG family transcription antiterminator n=1 Tax=unclassified Lactobacillus TaxID=2620435 RepID=UPI000EFCB877|nr:MULTISPECIES: PTS sugar transporter subunit IIA [unclassified Lactobacillus]RMC38587.1 PRD domain-containing protein [Lactobacillus sp. ESL0237]RMC42932.1 PRD domain-containing protein [Lactobacillus sp. ESL0234]RMC43786.1 PRD domain-containing protein [Lactobacillus sp. ESL0236]
MMTSNSASSVKAKRLLNYLVKSPSFVSLKEILETFSISRRTAFNWLKLINQTLRQNNLDEIINVPKYGYKITNQTKKKLLADTGIIETISRYSQIKSVNAADRQIMIVLMLIGENKYCSINVLARKFSCSRNTIIKDFKALNERFPQLEIASSRFGHRIISDESTIRRVIYELLLYQNKLVFKFIKHLDFSITEAKTIISTAQKQLEMTFSENSIEQLAYLLTFTRWRIEHGLCVSSTADLEWIKINTTNVLFTCEKILQSLIGKKLPRGEIVFLSKFILCSQATKVNCVKADLYHNLDSIAQEIIFRYEQLTEQKISYKLFTQVLCNHLYATFFRVKFDLPFSSNEVDEIKRQYPELVKFTAVACAPLEQFLHKKLPSNEVALIYLYFGSVSHKNYQDFSDMDKLQRAALADVLVVCSSGIGTSAMLYQELSKMYPLIKFSLPLEIRDLPQIFKRSYQAKLIISTANLTDTVYPIPVVNVRAVLTKHDQSAIEKLLRQKIPRKIEHNESAVNSLVSIINEYADVKDENGLRMSLDRFIFPKNQKSVHYNLPTLSNLLSANHIKFLHNNDDWNWQDVLHFGCEILEQDGIIDEYYCEKIIHLIQQYGPYMLIANNIFLAHAAPDTSSKKAGIVLILLDHPLVIEACQQKEIVTCMFVLSPGMKREHEKALEQLVDIVRDKENVLRLLKAKSIREVRQILLCF